MEAMGGLLVATVPGCLISQSLKCQEQGQRDKRTRIKGSYQRVSPWCCACNSRAGTCRSYPAPGIYPGLPTSGPLHMCAPCREHPSPGLLCLPPPPQLHVPSLMSPNSDRDTATVGAWQGASSSVTRTLVWESWHLAGAWGSSSLEICLSMAAASCLR